MSHEKGLVSIIVVTWNSRKDIVRCLQSFRGQSYSLVETIAVDDSSKDGTAELVKSELPGVRGKSLDDVIRCRLRIPESGLDGLFEKADIMMLPYEPLSRHSTSGCLIRATVCGLPVIVSNASPKRF